MCSNRNRQNRRISIPILQKLYKTDNRKSIKALILTPTRELAIQIGECFSAYGKYTGLRHAVIFGGVGQKPQTDELKRGVQIWLQLPDDCKTWSTKVSLT